MKTEKKQKESVTRIIIKLALIVQSVVKIYTRLKTQITSKKQYIMVLTEKCVTLLLDRQVFYYNIKKKLQKGNKAK